MSVGENTIESVMRVALLASLIDHDVDDSEAEMIGNIATEHIGSVFALASDGLSPILERANKDYESTEDYGELIRKYASAVTNPQLRDLALMFAASVVKSDGKINMNEFNMLDTLASEWDLDLSDYG